EVRTLSSRSVAVIVTRPSRASTSRLERIGMVVLRSTTPCVVLSSCSTADLVTLNSIAWLSSRAVQVADIRFPFISKPERRATETLEMVFRCCVLYSVLPPDERLYERVLHVEISGKRDRCRDKRRHFPACSQPKRPQTQPSTSTRRKQEP